jgi:hypothetical protein
MTEARHSILQPLKWTNGLVATRSKYAYMFLHKWLQTPYGYGESPKAKKNHLPPHNHTGITIWKR